MSKAVYRSVDNVARKVTEWYRSVGNVARRVTAGYIGVNNVARAFLGMSVLVPWSFYTETISPYSTLDAFEQTINPPDIRLSATVTTTNVSYVTDGRHCVGISLDVSEMTGKVLQFDYKTTNGTANYRDGYMAIFDANSGLLYEKYLNASTKTHVSITIPSNAKYVCIFVNCGASGTHTISMDIYSMTIDGIPVFSN